MHPWKSAARWENVYRGLGFLFVFAFLFMMGTPWGIVVVIGSVLVTSLPLYFLSSLRCPRIDGRFVGPWLFYPDITKCSACGARYPD